jgi:hypothetical protein
VFRGKGSRAVGARYREVSADGGATQQYQYLVEFCEPASTVAK